MVANFDWDKHSYVLQLPYSREVHLYYYVEPIGSHIPKIHCTICDPNGGTEHMEYYSGERDLSIQEAKHWAVEIAKEYFEEKFRCYKDLRNILDSTFVKRVW